MPSPSWRRTKNLINFLTPLSVQLSLEQEFSREKGNEILGEREGRNNGLTMTRLIKFAVK